MKKLKRKTNEIYKDDIAKRLYIDDMAKRLYIAMSYMVHLVHYQPKIAVFTVLISSVFR